MKPWRPLLAALGVLLLIGGWSWILDRWGRSRLPHLDWPVYRTMGGVLVLLGAAVSGWALRELGPRQAAGAVEHLVQSGPYRYVRHPLYTGVCTVLFGGGLLVGWWPLILTGCCWMIVVTVQARREEQELLRRFGEEYGEYMKRTGRFFPRRLGRSNL